MVWVHMWSADHRRDGLARHVASAGLAAYLLLTGTAVHSGGTSELPTQASMRRDHDVQRGTIAGASWVLKLPEPPIRGLFVFNHGYRTEAQRLSAEIDFDSEPFARALAAGYAVTASSFRRNGWIVCDAVSDSEALIEEISRRHGPFERILIAGESMGGAVALRMLEGAPGRYAGALILGDGLFSTDAGEPMCAGLSGAVADPVLALVNRSEHENARRYVESMAGAAPGAPVLWVVERDGHVNFNDDELASAFEALSSWSTGGDRPPPKRFAIAARPESSAVFEGCCAAAARVRSVDPNFGNLTTAFTKDDLVRLGIVVGATFELSYAGKTVRARRVSSYGEVERGDWLALVDGDGYLQVAINYADAAATLGVEVGDTVRIEAGNGEGERASGATTGPLR